MPSRSLVIAVTALLAVTALFVLLPAANPAGSPAPAAVPVGAAATSQPSASITYSILNGYGFTSNEFAPGEPGYGSLYFSVTDPLDRAVNVTITDPNAARDGVSSPAFQYEATLNATTFTFNSYMAGVGYTFPANLPYGGHWTVNFSAPNGGTVEQNVSVRLFYTFLGSSVGNGATLPGQPISVFWALVVGSNEGSFYPRATNVWITGSYIGNGTVQNFFPQGRVALSPVNVGTGTWSGKVPLNTTPDTQLHFEVYAIANVSGQLAENESGNLSISVGMLMIQSSGLTPAPPTCQFISDLYFTVNSLIAPCIEAGASYFGAFTPIAGLPVNVGYWNGTAHVTPSGAPTSVATNASGEAAFTFRASSPPFITALQYPTYDGINYTVHVPGASSLYPWTVWLNQTWSLLGGSTSAGVVQVALDHTEYYVGATATVSWTVSSTNATATGPVAATAYIIEGSSGVYFGIGAINSTAQSGSFTFPITSAMATQTLLVAVLASNSSTAFAGYASALVLTPSLLLSPASNFYNAGSTASVSAVINGGGSGATIQYEVWGYWQDGRAVVASGTVANGSSIAVSVPSSTPPLELEVYAWASVAGQVIATNNVTLDLAQGYSIQLGVTTASSYSDGSYQPGQIVTLSYQVVAIGGVALPQVVTFNLWTLGYPSSYTIQNVALSGTISYTIPSNAVQGTLLVELTAQGALAAAPCLPVGHCGGTAAIPINPHPSILSMELGPGSGITVGWLILLILVILVAILLVFFVFLRRRGGRSTAPIAPAMNPPAPPPSTPPAAEWKEPSAPPAAEPEPAASNPPPMPQPPSGGA
jgi:hypothetical protein